MKILQIQGVGREAACSFIGRVTLMNDDDDQPAFNFTSPFIKESESVQAVPAVDAHDFIAPFRHYLYPRYARGTDATQGVKRFSRLRY